MRDILLLIFLLGWLGFPPGQTVAQEVGPLLTINGVEFVRVPAGPFTMGSDTGTEDELPVHTVTLPDYYITHTEVTIAQYDQFVQATGERRPAGSGRASTHPVTDVSWFEALAYCSWLGQKSTFITGLPTEAEWEKAARGPDGRLYPWGEALDRTRANYGSEDRCCAPDASDGYIDTAPGGSFPLGASPSGALEMAGNVREWTSSLYWPYPYVSTDGREDPHAAGTRAVHGGSFNDDAFSLRAANRYGLVTPLRINDLGFRCVAQESL
ncbi:MAG: SUMF1/EgtB/PvdO family nonheme iron enzyme [Deinococcus sp.]|nr:SUMF1/EgtB/PvdO family nonheme iron enzyme [Deinococcus sp.]